MSGNSTPDKTWIQSYTGKKVHPFAPDPSMFDWYDQAHALSNLCRYTGHCREFYSVAEHAVRVSRRAEDLAYERAAHLYENSEEEQQEYVLMVARWGLIHEADEAYFNDLSRPVKYQPQMDEYRAAAKRLRNMFAEWAGLPPEQPEEVDQADLELLATEARDLMSPLHPDWAATAPGILCPLPIVICPWSPRAARTMWCMRAEDLGLGPAHWSRPWMIKGGSAWRR